MATWLMCINLFQLGWWLKLNSKYKEKHNMDIFKSIETLFNKTFSCIYKILCLYQKYDSDISSIASKWLSFNYHISILFVRYWFHAKQTKLSNQQNECTCHHKHECFHVVIIDGFSVTVICCLFLFFFLFEHRKKHM